ncbi:uncharacterized protein DS421_1g25030 [Arachis hypogaea]|nr:uncharacterized protein DS421_1g25030 [Arachis hypogaea]
MVVSPPLLTPLLQIVGLPSRSAVAPCRVVHFSLLPPLVASSPATTTTVSPITSSQTNLFDILKPQITIICCL